MQWEGAFCDRLIGMRIEALSLIYSLTHWIRRTASSLGVM